MPNYWTLLLLLTALPLGVALGLFFLRARLRRDGPKLATLVLGSLCLVICLFFTLTVGPYVWALHLESKWRPAEPVTKTEMESHLSLYSERALDPGDSGWGRDHRFNPGERMVRYSILGQPLDVVYTNDDRLVAIYTSYE